MDNKQDKGFTLVELLIVIVILGILATVTVFAVRGITDRARRTACKADEATLQTAVEAGLRAERARDRFRTTFGPSCMASLGEQQLEPRLTAGPSVARSGVTGATNPATDIGVTRPRLGRRSSSFPMTLDATCHPHRLDRRR